tara:strand:- start:66 stop:257 length:192 start_codon:yes stop_codon:yes gene_type:complete
MIEFEIATMLDQVRSGKMTADTFVNKCEAIVNNFNKELEKQGQAHYDEQESKNILEAETYGEK